ncbi:transcription antitermination NusG-related protein [Desulfocucumis palustris]|uniref:Transcription antitermination NusG-related protein n=1 Tax=Desulfocucumis palustris TaxID=1898651 RepID=A0A2L2XAL4_9FIRM|nr:transcription antitermination NusG-related protein [Desulfocucumis palustris]
MISILQWYVLRTISGKEEKALFLIQKLFHDVKIIFPKRRLSWRKKGKIIYVIKPLFSGYLFAAANYEQIEELHQWLRIQKANIWFVKVGNLLTPIDNHEMELIQKLMCNGDIVDSSEIQKNGESVMIVKGPLVGLEGIIEQYSKRNRRVVIKVNIGGEERRVELEGTSVSV